MESRHLRLPSAIPWDEVLFVPFLGGRVYFKRYIAHHRTRNGVTIPVLRIVLIDVKLANYLRAFRYFSVRADYCHNPDRCRYQGPQKWMVRFIASRVAGWTQKKEENIFQTVLKRVTQLWKF